MSKAPSLVRGIEEKIDSPKSHLELALAARRTAIVNDSDDEDESWDDF
ncbi:MAG: hypothetical protein NWR43_02880 [Alphaproteobacteria bacterium]|nr:hypothetical protein [Alphaproteobacteria bacterium]